jgi:hypothetical protein
MLRTILSAVAGAVAWGVIVTLLNFGLRYGLPGYHAAEPKMAFDLTMMIARLTESTIALVIAALVTARLSKGAALAPWLLAAAMLAIFVPVHLSIWDKFPVWYHAYFLGSLLVVPLAVGRRARPGD